MASRGNWCKKNDAWKIRGSQINVNEIPDKDFYQYFVVKEEVREFIRSVDKKIIKAPKGYGKTLFLRKKANDFMRIHHNETFPQNSLVEDGRNSKIPILENNTFRKNYYIGGKDLDSKTQISQKIANLKNAWVAAFITASYEYIHNTDENKSNRVLLSFRNNLSLNVSELDEIINGKKYEDFNQECYVFVDNLDKLVDFGYEVKSSEGDTFIADVGIRQFWVAIQMAFCLAVFEMPKKHIHIYGSVRHEALSLLEENYFEYTDLTKLNDIITRIEYKKVDIKRMFFNNISMSMDCEIIEDRKYNEYLKKYFHLKVVTINNTITGKREKLFDYLYRHSLYKPRDIIVIGDKLKNLREEPSSERVDHIKSVVHDQTLYKSIVGDYLTEIGSPLQGRISKLSRYHRKINNILTFTEIKKLCRWINNINDDTECDDCSQCDKLHYFCSLYNAGLLGFEKGYNEKVEQKFQLPHEREDIIKGGVNAIGKLRKLDYFFLHPLLYGRARFSMNRHVLIGDRELFYKTKNIKMKKMPFDKYKISIKVDGDWYILLQIINSSKIIEGEFRYKDAVAIRNDSSLIDFFNNDIIDLIYTMALEFELKSFADEVDP